MYIVRPTSSRVNVFVSMIITTLGLDTASTIRVGLISFIASTIIRVRHDDDYPGRVN